MLSRMSRGAGSEAMMVKDWLVRRRGVARLCASWRELYNFVGHLGKAIFPLFGKFSYVWGIGLLLLVCGCEGSDPSTFLQSGRVVSLGGLEGRWVGPVDPEGGGCGHATTGLMNIGQGGFGFAPFQNTVVLHGKIGADDSVSGVEERISGDKQILAIRFEGQVVQSDGEQDKIEGALTSGRCRWRVMLTRG